MYEVSYGDKYEKGLDIKEIAKRMRVDIKRAVADGELPDEKYSVRIRRFSGGQSMDVTIKTWDGPVLNHRAIELDHETRKGAAALGKEKYRDLCEEYRKTERMVPELIKAIKALGRLAGQWNHDGSEIQVDYWNVNYYSHVDVSSNLTYNEWQEVTDKLKARDAEAVPALKIFRPSA